MQTEKRVFISTPATAEFTPIRETIVQQVQKVGYEPISAEDIHVKGSVTESVYNAILGAALVIVDLTGQNPNVMFELGFAQGSRTPVLLMVQRNSGEIPFDLSGRQFVVYDQTHLPELRERLSLALEVHSQAWQGAIVGG